MTEPTHLVLLEAGAKQAFIFDTSKQAANVGASDLIHRMGVEWAKPFLDRDGVEKLVTLSGKALLLTSDVDTARGIVEKVTRRALTDAPGLDVCGVVQRIATAPADPDRGIAKGTLAAAVGAATRERARVRAARVGPDARMPGLPYDQPCQYTARPATDLGAERHGGTEFPRADGVHATYEQGKRSGRRRLARKLSTEEGAESIAVVPDDKLATGVTHKGWIAVLHADGNGVGALFANLGRLTDFAEYRTTYRTLSELLESITWDALRFAVARVTAEHPELEAGWLLPIVVGGDDVTAIVDGRYAFPLTHHFLVAFAEQAAANGELQRIMTRLSERAGGTLAPLTASAGLAYVKPHHPFSDAYQLAEQLCTDSAKTKKPFGALDFHVLHDSVGRDLAVLRPTPRTGDPHRWGGPYLVGVPETDDEHGRRVELLLDARKRQEGSAPVLRPGAVQRLRAALVAGGEQLGREAEQICVWQDDPEAAAAYLADHLGRAGPEATFSRVEDALHLIDMTRGTVGHPDRTEERR